MAENDSISDEQRARDLLERLVGPYLKLARREGHSAQTTIPLASAYLVKCSTDRQEQLMNDMHKQSSAMTTLTRVMIVLTVAILIATGVNIWATVANRSGPVASAQAFELIDQEGNRRARLGISPEGSVALGFFDADGKVRSTVGLLSGGRPVNTILAADGTPVWSAP